MSKTIKIDVISDFVCAWCYIGHLDLERAIAQAQAENLSVSFEVQYHPFILNPSLSCDETIPKVDFYKKKLGDANFEKMTELVLARSKEEGLTFSYNGVVRQTHRPHRLMLKAYRVGGQATQLTLIKTLFKAFFEDDKDIGDVEILVPFAVSSGVFTTEADAKAFLDSHELEEEVKFMSGEAVKKGVTGVPFTIIDGKWAVSGCQPPDCYFKIFEKLAEKEVTTPQPKPPVATAITA